MDADETIELLKVLSGAYPQFKINEHTPKVWNDMLTDQDFEGVMYRARKHIATNPHPPAISDLKIKRYPVIG